MNRNRRAQGSTWANIASANRDQSRTIQLSGTVSSPHWEKPFSLNVLGNSQDKLLFMPHGTEFIGTNSSSSNRDLSTMFSATLLSTKKPNEGERVCFVLPSSTRAEIRLWSYSMTPRVRAKQKRKKKLNTPHSHMRLRLKLCERACCYFWILGALPCKCSPHCEIGVICSLFTHPFSIIFYHLLVFSVLMWRVFSRLLTSVANSLQLISLWSRVLENIINLIF